ncbi:MAG: glycosyltransferase [Wenyingzhuangia sp.]|jgi:cellulose synthase/poly-beta-1,6-N-acetylglucosamine synthase-like glycosyltransferase|uniref:glycosyltransferase n=1 Tax=Wenyingzhuangia sp. TaxID=1964193 RepID=UPI003219CF02
MYSFVIPVYNRPDEIDELLYSLTQQDFEEPFEIVVIEDGSDKAAVEIINQYKNRLTIQYYVIENQGAGKARNYGMSRAKGDYFIVLDSDVLVPTNYLKEVSKALQEKMTDAFGGPDTAHFSFTPLQKAINFSMTSFLTTGGIRGKKKGIGRFQPRSFNFGVSKKAFEATKGFSSMRVGEDIDFSFRLWQQGFETQLIEKAVVYHKRRTSLDAFFTQVFRFGVARPVLNKRYPGTAKFTYWFPSIFTIGFFLSSFLFVLGQWVPIILYNMYFTLLFMLSVLENRNITVAFLSVITTLIQMTGYGLGFLKSTFFSPE